MARGWRTARRPTRCSTPWRSARVESGFPLPPPSWASPTCTDTGTWLVHEDLISSWTVPERAVLKAHGGADNVNARLGQLNPARQIACTGGEPPVLSTHNITKVSAKVDFVTTGNVFRRWRRIFRNAQKRHQASS